MEPSFLHNYTDSTLNRLISIEAYSPSLCILRLFRLFRSGSSIHHGAYQSLGLYRPGNLVGYRYSH
ncbi:hypothetical protein ACM6L3_08525 [Paenibacillus larvae]